MVEPLSIFDLVDLPDDVALRLVLTTVDRHPVLRRIFDDKFIDRLIRRPRITNFLLLLLVRPEDEYADAYWAGVADDLLLLEAEGAFEHFARKLRLRSRPDLEAGRSELALAARLKRQGVGVALEVPTRNGRDCDFRADTIPRTWWEVKAVSDLDFVVVNDDVALHVQQGLRRIEAPYVLSLGRTTVTKGDVPRAIKSIKNQIAKHHSRGRPLPARFEAYGLVVEATDETKRANGYLGIVTSAYEFKDEQAERIRRRIVDAISQLPDMGGGVVVIDSTDATWVDADDVIDACFGPVRSFISTDGFVDVHDARLAAFQPRQRTRVSAVLHYSRHPRHVSGESEAYTLYVVHNPFASVPLPKEIFGNVGVLHCQATDDGNGRFTITNGIMTETA